METEEIESREWIKANLANLPSSDILIFRRMYDAGSEDQDIATIVDSIARTRLMWVKMQITNTLDSRKIKEVTREEVMSSTYAKRGRIHPYKTKRRVIDTDQ